MPEYSQRVGRLLNELSDEEMAELTAVVRGGFAKSPVMTIEDYFEDATIEQRQRVVALLCARRALVGEEPKTKGGILMGNVTPRGALLQSWELIPVAAFVMDGSLVGILGGDDDIEQDAEGQETSDE